MKRVLSYLLILAAGVLLGRWLMYRHYLNILGSEVKPQTDTVYLHDTVRKYYPKYVERRVVDTVYFPVDTTRADTTLVPLPVEERVYEDSLYRAVVSGIMPSLDTIEVYSSTVVVTEEVTRWEETSPWSVGFSAGYGFGMNDGVVRATPYIGIGIQYNLIKFKKNVKRRN